MTARLSSVLAPVLTLVAALFIWETAVRLFDISKLLLPPPSAILVEFVDSIDVILKNSYVTLTEVVLGFLLSVAIGIPIALVIFFSPTLGRGVYPLLVASQATPKSAIAPLFIVWFGVGILPKVLLTFLIAFFPIVISTVTGLESLEREKVLLGRSMGMSSVRFFFMIRLPQAGPSIFGGFKIAITLAVIGAVVAEFVGSNAGLGYLLLVANGRFDVALLFAALLALTAMGTFLFAAVAGIQRIVVPWQVSSED
jgi:NitT/TauT family transport system permease protein